MTSKKIKTEPETANSFHQACRLCLSEESLGDIFSGKDLQRWISDFLLIVVSPEDRMSQVICANCRKRLTDFHQFRTHCQEVQSYLLSAMDGADSVMNEQKQIFQQISVVEPGPIVDRRYNQQDVSLPMISYLRDLSHDSFQDVEGKNQANGQREVVEGEESIGKEDIIDIEQVKIEIPSDDEDDDVESADNSSSTSRRYDAHKIRKNLIVSEKTEADNDQSVEMEENISNNQLFQCNICQKVLKTKHILLYHEKAAHGPKTIMCKVCGIGFPFQTQLKKHELSKKHLEKLQEIQEVPEEEEISAGVEMVQCEICHKTYRSKTHLGWHKRVAHGSKNHRCNVCDIAFTLQTDLKRHELTARHMDKLMESPENQRLYAQDIQRIQALIQKANDKAKSDQQWPCDKCDKCFSSKINLRKHQVYHGSKNYICPICEKPCFTRYSLQQHIPTHDPINERRIVPDDELLECEICQKKFVQRYLLTRHKKQAHEPKIHGCHICGGKFTTRTLLSIHINRHTDEDKEVFNSVPRSSTISTTNLDGKEINIKSENDVKKPIITSFETEQKPKASSLQCTQCDKVCKNQNRLWVHYKFAHKDRMKCSFCRATFVMKEQLDRHVLEKHKQEASSL